MKNKNEVSIQLLKWYRNIVIGVSVIWVLFVAIFLKLIPFYILGAISFSFLIYIFSFLLLKQHVFSLEKYSNSSINRKVSKKLLEELKSLFETEAMYLENSISLNSVAERLSVRPRELSQVINENEQKNFSEFVNHYRIKRAKQLLIDPNYDLEKIATVAYDSGFGNVTSFNLAFKFETRITPSQYRNQYKVT